MGAYAPTNIPASSNLSPGGHPMFRHSTTSPNPSSNPQSPLPPGGASGAGAGAAGAAASPAQVAQAQYQHQLQLHLQRQNSMTSPSPQPGAVPQNHYTTYGQAQQAMQIQQMQAYGQQQQQKNAADQQMQGIRQQYLAYKYLARNMPLPPQLLQTVVKNSTDAQMQQQTALAAAQSAARQQTVSADGIQTPGKTHLPGTPEVKEESPAVVMARHAASYAMQNSYDQSAVIAHANAQAMTAIKPIDSFKAADKADPWRFVVPARQPLGLDHYAMRDEQERIMNLRIKQRITELQNCPSTLPHDAGKFGLETGDAAVDTRPTGSPQILSENTKLLSLIELKALQLLPRQRRLRQELVAGVQRSSTLLSTADRTALRRAKRPAVREARATERLERMQRAEKEKKEKQKHASFLSSVLMHAREMSNFHSRQHMKQSKFGRMVMQFHVKAEKEEQARRQRISQERLKALKADDEEAYLKLIDQTKDTRITQLLKQTDSYLGSLTAAVAMQKKSVYAPASRTAHAEPDDEDDEYNMVDRNGKPLDYYKIAHKINEEIKEQASILVGGTLKDYQLKGLQWMISLYNNHLNGILADEMGLGKTIQTISLVTTLIERKNQNGPFLIIVPLSTLTNWVMEFEKWAPSVVMVVYKGGPATRKQIEREQIRSGRFNVLVTTYEFIIKDRPVLSKIHWLYTIIDEGHRMKNAQSKLSVTLTMHYHSKYRLILTGTPLQNNLPELWALLNFILPKVFNSVKSFDDWFSAPFVGSGIGKGEEKMELNEEERLLIIKRLHKVLRPFLLRRLKKDVESELPDKVERVVKCSMSALQKRLYDQMRKHGVLVTEGSGDGLSKGLTSGIKGLNNTIMQLRKICNHPFVFKEVEQVVNPSNNTDDLIWRAAGKFELLERMLTKLKRTNHRVLVFFQMTNVMNIFEDFLVIKGFKYLRLDGSTKSDDRSALLGLFNDRDSPYFLFILSTRAGGMGLNLQTADTVIIFDSDWNPHQDLQAQDRAHRIGQTKEVRIFRLITEKSIEEQILARAQYKLDMDGKVIQAGKFDNKSTAEERERFLRQLLENDMEKPEDDDVDNEDELNDDELNEMLARGAHELVIFREMDRENPPGDRLMQEHELPLWYRQESDMLGKAREDPAEMEDGVRISRNKSGVVDYLMVEDGLTEEQWMEAIENEDVDYNELIKRKAEKQLRKFERKEERRKNALLHQKKKRKTSDMGDDGESEESNVSSSKSTGKRGRKRRLEDDDPTYEEDSANAPPPRKRTTLAVEEDPQAQLKAEVKKIGRAIWDAVASFTDDSGRLRATLFHDLPSKKEYPTYYLEIKKPLAMTQIRRRLDSQKYTSIPAIMSDFQLMVNNAKAFNQEGSEVYDDAEAIWAEVQRLANTLAPGGVMLQRKSPMTEMRAPALAAQSVSAVAIPEGGMMGAAVAEDSNGSIGVNMLQATPLPAVPGDSAAANNSEPQAPPGLGATSVNGNGHPS